MPELTIPLAGGIILLGAVVGFLSGLFGVGGGFMLTPMLNIAFGIPMNIAVGSGLAQMIGTGTTATLRHGKESTVDVKLALILLGGTVGGIELGTELLEKLDHLGNAAIFSRHVPWLWVVTMSAFVVVLGGVGVVTLVESWHHQRRVSEGEEVPRRVGRGLFSRALFPPLTTLSATEGRPAPLLAIVVLGLAVGVLQGLLGIGGGVVFIPALIYLLGCSTRAAVGTSLLVVTLGSVAGTITHGLRGNVDLGLVALILLSSTAGAAFGAAIHHRITPARIRLYFSLVLLLTLVVIVAKMLHEFGVFS